MQLLEETLILKSYTKKSYIFGKSQKKIRTFLARKIKLDKAVLLKKLHYSSFMLYCSKLPFDGLHSLLICQEELIRSFGCSKVFLEE